MVSTGGTANRSVTTNRVWSGGNQLALMVYSLYDDKDFGPIEYAEITRYELDERMVGVRDPLGYDVTFNQNGEGFGEDFIGDPIYNRWRFLAWTSGSDPGDTFQFRVRSVCTENPDEFAEDRYIVSAWVYSGTVTIPTPTPTPTHTPFGTPPPTPTDHPGYSSCPRPGNPRFDYANTDGVFFSFNPASYTNPCEVSGLRYTSTSIDDVRLEWTNPSNLVHLRINGLASGSLQDDEPFTTDWDQDLTRFNTDNITFELILFSRCSDGTRGVRTSQPLVFGTGFEPFRAASHPYARQPIHWSIQRADGRRQSVALRSAGQSNHHRHRR